MTTEASIMDKIISAEATADLMIKEGTALKEACRAARVKLEGGGSPSARKGLTAIQKAGLLAKRQKRILQQQNKQS